MPILSAHPATDGGGSLLYRLSAEHAAAVALLVVFALALFLLRGRLRSLPPSDALLFGLLGASAAVHAGLALGGGAHGGGLRLLFLADAALLAIVARRVLRGARAGSLGAAVLVASVVAYWAAALGGETPDQLGLATKLAEILALALVVRPEPGRRSPRTSGAIVALLFCTALTSWIGAFRAGGAEALHAHADGAATPGTVLPAVPDRAPTADERAAATELWVATRDAIAKYADPAVAAAAGYQVAGIHGVDFHAGNPAYEHDGRVFDPARPESLVYGVTPQGRAVLFGAVFQMPDLSTSGPAVGGPLTVWHGHEQICITPLPLSLTGVLSPLGMCPLGSIAAPRTPQMIHVWVVPGAPQAIGDLDDAWRRAYVRTR